MIEHDRQRVLIFSSSPVVRAGLISLLSVETARLGLKILEAGPLTEPTEFDVAVISDGTDEELFDELLDNLHDSGSGVVVLCEENLSRQRAATLSEARLPGWAILPPDATAEEMAASILTASQGLVTVGPNLVESILPPTPTSGSPLTPRETEVLGLISHGLPNKSIARDLGISGHTVKFHISSIYTKLDAANRAEAVSVAARLGLITL